MIYSKQETGLNDDFCFPLIYFWKFYSKLLWLELLMHGRGERGHKLLCISFFFSFGNRSLLWVVRFDSLGPPLTEEVGFYLHRHLRVRMGLSGRNLEI